MNRSEAPFSTTNLSSLSNSIFLLESIFSNPKKASERVRHLRFFARGFAADRPLLHELEQALVERLHAHCGLRLNHRVHLRDLAFTDQVPDCRRADHDLVRRDAAAVHSL